MKIYLHQTQTRISNDIDYEEEEEDWLKSNASIMKIYLHQTHTLTRISIDIDDDEEEEEPFLFEPLYGRRSGRLANKPRINYEVLSSSDTYTDSYIE